MMREKNKNTGDDFDRDLPMSGVFRNLVPGECEMDAAEQDRMISRLLAVQAEKTAGGKAPRRHVHWSRYALVGVAAAAVIALVLILALPGGKKVGLSGKVNIEAGTAEIRKPGGGWQAAKDKMTVAAGWRVRTGRGSLASVVFPDKSIMRITDDSEAQVKVIAAGKVEVQHLSGGTYHRIHKGTRYAVWNNGVAVRALGTAFNIENRVPDKLEVVTIQNAVKVDIGKQEPIKVDQGEVLVVSLADKTSDVQPVSKQRLQDTRLLASVQQDAEAGYPTGVYESIVPQPESSAPVAESSTPQSSEPAPVAPALPIISLGGAAYETGVNLNWGVSGDVTYDTIVLLRSEVPNPVYPDNEISRYTDISTTAATDNNVQPGHTYYYSIYTLDGSEAVAMSNPITITIPQPGVKPAPASISLMVTATSNSAIVAWTVNGTTTGFDGFLIEREVLGAPDGSPTPGGARKTIRINSKDPSYSYTDTEVLPGHAYEYRVGLVVNGAVTVYSYTDTATIPGP